ncbi:1D-myo-inositol 2-acetamido-2-deoxy-alpha-D-glucopyranoside deacetylase [Microbacterium oleivorans]|uniref:PIG-L family deacetylase n=1 Tax=Microbacterium oleivorans TaxID=273677 RepID=UPI000F8F9498|nr:PIG-L family deacetylase [Microbacterium oleivorans]AZS43284.1 1D-myo-inositol 2-acetamido-2-deoxy-alpha-D-glucopyranoside deacetylase [Microbacterium oleivorans]
MVSFSHRDPGTDEAVWREVFVDRELPPLDETFEHLIVVSAHPDDETLGAAGLIARTKRRGASVSVIIATDGEGSHPESPTHTPVELAAVRRREVAEALGQLGSSIDLQFLGLPDGGTDDHRDAIEDALHAVLQGNDAHLVVVPWVGDGHRDHRVAAEVTAGVCADLGVPWREYPIWLWHWGSPDDVPWGDLEVVPLDESTVDLKRTATDRHRSQIAPLSSAPGDEVMLHKRMQAHFDRNLEVFVRPAGSSLAEDFFEEFYRRNGDDPWGFESRWYEQRKRAVALASLPRARYGSALELGCSTGILTELLAERCDAVLAVDIAGAPLEVARRRLSERGDVRFERLALPGEWPAGTFDLVVLSEVGYYWSAADLAVAIGRIRRAMDAGGHLIACHWRHPVGEYPQSGDDVHAALRAAEGFVRLVLHDEEDFVLEVYGLEGARSVAAETGLIA